MNAIFLAAFRLWCFAVMLTTLAAEKQLLGNGGFESGSSVWSTYAVSSGVGTSSGIVDLGNARTGKWYAFLGDKSPSLTHARGVVRQDVDIPENTESIILSFWLNITSDETANRPIDTFGAYLRTFDDNAVSTFAEFSNKEKNIQNNPKTYFLVSKSIPGTAFKGKRVILQLYAQTGDSLYTTFRVDDVTLVAITTDQPKTFSVSVSAGIGGTVAPEGITSVEKGGSLKLSAIPNGDSEVDVWLVNGNRSHYGDSSWTLRDIQEDTVVIVTFQPKQYRIDVQPAVGGEFVIDPRRDTYSAGSAVRIIAKSDNRYFFSGWTGDANGLDPSLTFSVDRNITIGGWFTLFAQPASFRIANSTPAIIGDLPSSPGYNYLIQKSKDLCCWQDVSVVDADNAASIVLTPTADHSDGDEFSRAVLCPKIVVKPFLRFPLKGLKPDTARVTAVLDHHAPNKRDGIIAAWGGYVVKMNEKNGKGIININGVDQTVPVSPYSHADNFFDKRDANGKRIYTTIHLDLPDQLPLFPFTYNDTKALWYDGHGGYDYSVRKDGVIFYKEVVAAARGRLVLEKTDTCWHEICLEHNGYRTLYLHLGKWSQRVENALNQRDENAIFEAGEILGEPGGRGCEGATPVLNQYAVHLHFAVERLDGATQTWIITDPYGKRALDGNECEPSLWLPNSDY